MPVGQSPGLSVVPSAKVTTNCSPHNDVQAGHWITRGAVPTAAWADCYGVRVALPGVSGKAGASVAAPLLRIRVGVGVAPCRLRLIEDVPGQSSGRFIVDNVGSVGRVFDHGNGDVGQEPCYLGGLLGAIAQAEVLRPALQR